METIEEQIVILNEVISTKVDTVDGIIQSIEVSVLSGKGLETALLQNLSEGNVYITSIHYIDEEGNITSSLDFETSDVNPEEYGFFSDAQMMGGALYMEPYINHTTGERAITFSKAIYERDRYLGVVGIDMKLDYLFESFMKFSEKNVKGYIIYRNEEIFYTDLKAQEINLLMNAIQNDYSDELSGYILNSDMSQIGFDLKVIARESKLSIITASYRIVVFAGGLLYLIMIIVFLQKMLRVVLDPFNNLKLYVMEIKNGNYDIDRNYYQEDEFSNLYMGFFRLGNYLKRNIIQLNNMKDLLKEKHLELNEKNRTLEIQYKNIQESRKDIENQINVYSNIVETITDMIWEIDYDGRFIKINQSFINQIGFSREEIIGRTFSDFTENYLSQDRLIEMIRRKDYERIDFTFITKNSEKRLYQTKLFRIFDSKGKIKEIQALSVDKSTGDGKFLELEYRSRELAILGELSHEILIQQTTEEIVDSFTNRLKVLLHVEAITVRLLHDNQLINAEKLNQERNTIKSDVIGIDQSNEEAVLKTGSIVVMKTPEDLLYPDEFLESYLKGRGSLLFVPLKGEKKTIGIVTIATSEELITPRLGLIESMAIKISMAINNRLIFEELGKNYLNTVNVLNAIIRAKSSKYYKKSLSVAKIAKFIGKGLYLKEQDIIELGIVGLIKDIGIIGLPDYLLRKKIIEMNVEEIQQFDKHSEIGYRIVSPLDYDQRIINSVKNHHNACKSGDYHKTDFEKIICFANYMEKEIENQPLNNAEDIDAFLHKVESELSNQDCLDYLDVFFRAMKIDPNEVIEMMESIKRGDRNEAI
jgi:PAS domain S-box-containing protein